MKLILSIGLIALSPTIASAATVTLNNDTNRLFETSGGDALVGGHLFAGTFDTAPSIGLSLADIQADYNVFAPSSVNPTNEFGAIGNSVFDGNLSGFESKKIYILALSSDDLATAPASSEYAVFSANLAAWQFQADDSGFPPVVNISQVDQFFAGEFSTITDPGGVGGTFPSIQLIPEPSSSLLVLLGIAGLLRRQR